MKPTVRLAAARTPDGSEVVLCRHDADFLIKVNGQELMNSRRHESEQELARLGCAHLAGRAAPRVLVGGLGMGYTLRQALDLLPADARIVVVELLADVVAWNREWLGPLSGHPLSDARVEVVVGDVLPLIQDRPGTFDAILLDIDNGPGAMTDAGNRRLYGHSGIGACRRALRGRGCLAVWSGAESKAFERTLVDCGFQVRRYRAPAYEGGKSRPCFVWVAGEDAAVLPPGGGEPHFPAPSRRRPYRHRR